MKSPHVTPSRPPNLYRPSLGVLLLHPAHWRLRIRQSCCNAPFGNTVFQDICWLFILNSLPHVLQNNYCEILSEGNQCLWITLSLLCFHLEFIAVVNLNTFNTVFLTWVQVVIAMSQVFFLAFKWILSRGLCICFIKRESKRCSECFFELCRQCQQVTV